MIPVWWLEAHPLCDDQHIIDLIAPPDLFTHRLNPPAETGAVVVCPARYYTPEQVNDLIRPLPWCVLILTSDEESTFDQTAIDHPNVKCWVMTPRPDRPYHEGTRFIGEGFNPATRPTLKATGNPARTTDVYLAGQDTHRRRHDLFDKLEGSQRGWSRDVTRTPGFMQGFDRTEYLSRMASAKVAPCPSGPATPDSFRLYEALEAGCVPLADMTAPGTYPGRGYWDMVMPGAPFEQVAHWHEVEKYIATALHGWPRKAAECQAWWVRHKRRMALDLLDDVAEVAGLPAPTRGVDDMVTVLMPTSPIPSHPSLDIISETVASVRDRLPGAEILIMADGVADHLAERTTDYHEYLRRLAWECNHVWSGVTPFLFDTHTHQVGMTRRILDEVRTPLVLFVEHDTPLVGDVDWVGCARAVMSGASNLIRFHHEASVLEPHKHLMVDEVPRLVEGVPLLRTVQWSQRPHLAATGVYRTWLDARWWAESDGMIEDRMHGVVENDWLQHRDPGRFRLSMYAPEGDIKRSTHLDGRGTDPKVTEL
jgi:hypothetical protein